MALMGHHTPPQRNENDNQTSKDGYKELCDF